MPSDSNSPDRSSLLALSRELGIALLGVADIRPVRDSFLLDPRTSRRFDRAISLALRLSDSILEDIEDRPTPLYFHHYRQANAILDRAAFSVAGFIQSRGFRALPIAASQIIDWDRQMGHVPHKRIGHLAGLGWIGRNNLLVNGENGARIRLVSVLTDMPLETDGPVEFGCGSCRACLSVCPAQAIHDEPAGFEHKACFAQLQDFRRKGLVSQFICGVCVKACRGRAQSKG